MTHRGKPTLKKIEDVRKSCMRGSNRSCPIPKARKTEHQCNISSGGTGLSLTWKLSGQIMYVGWRQST